MTGLAAGLAAGLTASGLALVLSGADAPRTARTSEVAATGALAPQPLLPSRAARASRGTARTSLAPSLALPTHLVTRTVATGATFSGEASWYGGFFQGRRTASGERFDTSDLTAASKTLPFGTRLRVCHAGRCVVVRVNDRGPYVGGRVLDLSRAAAQQIGYSGVAYVTATPIAERSVRVVDDRAVAAQRLVARRQAAARAVEVAQARARRAAQQAEQTRLSLAAAQSPVGPDGLPLLPVGIGIAAFLATSGVLIGTRRRAHART